MAPLPLLIALLLALIPRSAAFYNPLVPMRGRGRAPASEWRTLRRTCRASPACAGFAEDDEAEDCVLRCTSPACWARVYEGDVLEPGQFNTARERVYDACLKRSESALQAAGKWPPTPGGDGGGTPPLQPMPPQQPTSQQQQQQQDL